MSRVQTVDLRAAVPGHIQDRTTYLKECEVMRARLAVGEYVIAPQCELVIRGGVRRRAGEAVTADELVDAHEDTFDAVTLRMRRSNVMAQLVRSGVVVTKY